MIALPQHLRMPDIIALRNGRFHLGLAPAQGGSVAYFAEQRPEGLRHWFRPASAAALASGNGHHSACFPLVPVSGRIAEAMLNWDGSLIAVPRNARPEPHHLHGEGWQRPWEIVETGPNRATLALSHARDWPFPYAASFTYLLERDGLKVVMTMTNRGDAAMPAAIGLHPWFPAPLAELTAAAGTLWEIDSRKLFTGKIAPSPQRQFAGGRSLKGADLEHGFTDWDRKAVLHWPGRPGRLVMTASETLAHLVVYSRDPSEDFCVEPVSCSVDAFNLHASGVADTGTVRLEPGETLSGTAWFQIEG